MLDIHLQTDKSMAARRRAGAIDRWPMGRPDLWRIQCPASGPINWPASGPAGCWPDSEQWSEGEIDFPRGPWTGRSMPTTIASVIRPVLPAGGHRCFLSDWHTATIEWTPASDITYLLDGVVVASTRKASRRPLPLGFQTATTGIRPAPQTQGHVWVDWVAIYAYDGPPSPKCRADAPLSRGTQGRPQQLPTQRVVHLTQSEPSNLFPDSSP